MIPLNRTPQLTGYETPTCNMSSTPYHPRALEHLLITNAHEAFVSDIGGDEGVLAAGDVRVTSQLDSFQPPGRCIIVIQALPQTGEQRLSPPQLLRPQRGERALLSPSYRRARRMTRSVPLLLARGRVSFSHHTKSLATPYPASAYSSQEVGSLLGKPAAKKAGGEPGDPGEGPLFRPRAAERPFGELNGTEMMLADLAQSRRTRNGGHNRVCSVMAALGKFRQSMKELYSPASANVSIRTSLLYLLGVSALADGGIKRLEGVVTALGNNSMRLDASLCRVVASNEKLAAGLAVGEPDTVAREEPVWMRLMDIGADKGLPKGVVVCVTEEAVTSLCSAAKVERREICEDV
ncbi:hypothetical protein KC360_g156 [Hortaea werneckii]|nr:hypothetical protein KC360_g156 [Hortaea werneckii]